MEVRVRVHLRNNPKVVEEVAQTMDTMVKAGVGYVDIVGLVEVVAATNGTKPRRVMKKYSTKGPRDVKKDVRYAAKKWVKDFNTMVFEAATQNIKLGELADKAGINRPRMSSFRQGMCRPRKEEIPNIDRAVSELGLEYKIDWADV